MSRRFHRKCPCQRRWNCSARRRISGAPVVLDGKLVGVISLEDLIRCLTNGELATTVESTCHAIWLRCTTPTRWSKRSSCLSIAATDACRSWMMTATWSASSPRATSRWPAPGPAARLPGRGAAPLPRQPPLRRYHLRPHQPDPALHHQAGRFHPRRRGLQLHQARPAAPGRQPADRPAAGDRRLRSGDEPDHPHHQRRDHPGGDRAAPDHHRSLRRWPGD